MEYALRQKHTHRHHLYVFARGNTYKKLQKHIFFYHKTSIKALSLEGQIKDIRQ